MKSQINTDEHRYQLKKIGVYLCSSVVPTFLFFLALRSQRLCGEL